MYEYSYGKRLSNNMLDIYKKKFISSFGKSYDIKKNRLWNCLKVPSRCVKFEDARNIKWPNSEELIFYLERQDEVYQTNYDEVCKYIDELEPWEYIDAYITDKTFSWLIAITHEELLCLVVEL